MDAWISAFAVVSLFVVRLGVPIVAMVGLGIALHRLDRRWQREAADEAMRTLDVTVPDSPTAPLETPCWELKNCSPQKREKCPAAHNSALPCWLVRRDAEGCIPESCFVCALFKRTRTSDQVAMAGDD